MSVLKLYPSSPHCYYIIIMFTCQMPLYVGNMIPMRKLTIIYDQYMVMVIYGNGHIWVYMVTIWPVAYLHCRFFFSFFNMQCLTY